MKLIFFRVPAWLFLVFLTVLTVVPAPERPNTGIEHNLEHFLAFALLGILFALSYPGRLVRLTIGMLVFTSLIELSQIPLPTRHARFPDFLFDTLAVWIGIFVIFASRRFVRIAIPATTRATR